MLKFLRPYLSRRSRDPLFQVDFIGGVKEFHLCRPVNMAAGDVRTSIGAEIPRFPQRNRSGPASIGNAAVKQLKQRPNIPKTE